MTGRESVGFRVGLPSVHGNKGGDFVLHSLPEPGGVGTSHGVPIREDIRIGWLEGGSIRERRHGNIDRTVD